MLLALNLKLPFVKCVIEKKKTPTLCGAEAGGDLVVVASASEQNDQVSRAMFFSYPLDVQRDDEYHEGNG